MVKTGKKLAPLFEILVYTQKKKKKKSFVGLYTPSHSQGGFWRQALVDMSSSHGRYCLFQTTHLGWERPLK